MTGIVPPTASGPRPALDDIIDPGSVDPFSQFQKPPDPELGVMGTGGGGRRE
jgi:hypothetical protein